MKSIITKYLEVEGEEISYNEFEKLNELGETNIIDRKSIVDFRDINANKSKIQKMLSKEISAFANYEGGILLIGINNDGIIEDGISKEFGRTTVKEWLEDVIYTCNSPSVNEFTIKYVPKDDKYLLVIIIAKSDFAPHQANHGEYKFKYYLRIDGKSLPIDGIIVRDIFNRKIYADLDLKINLPPSRYLNNGIHFLELNLIVINNSNVPADNVMLLMDLNKELFLNRNNSDFYSFSKTHGQFKYELVYPGLGANLVPDSSAIQLKTFDNFTIDFTLIAKNSARKDFKYYIQNNDGNISINKI